MVDVIPLTGRHWEAVRRIFQQGIDSRNATFRTEVPVWEAWNRDHLNHSRFVALKENKVVGWAALAPMSNRKAYVGVAEMSLYIDTDFHGQGIGNLLFQTLIASSEINGIWTLFSSIFPENKATYHIHLKNGFRVVGTREKIAKLDDEWRDTIILERRSPKF